MNAASRLVHQGILSRHLILTRLLTRTQIAVMSLTTAVLLTAVGIIYMTHTTRDLYASYQHNLIEQNRLHVTHGQLLLERSTWLMQSRIQQIAENQLGMILPNHKKMKVIHYSNVVVREPTPTN